MEKGKESALLSYLNEHEADKYTSWADLYARLKHVAQQFVDAPSLGSAALAVASLLSFVLALEELPEEGDVVVIARKLNEILALRPEVTGVSLHSIEELPAVAAQHLQQIVEEVERSQADTPEAPTKSRVLH